MSNDCPRDFPVGLRSDRDPWRRREHKHPIRSKRAILTNVHPQSPRLALGVMSVNSVN